MKKVEEIKKFLEVEELSKLEQGAVQGGQAEGKQKQKQKIKIINSTNLK